MKITSLTVFETDYTVTEGGFNLSGGRQFKKFRSAVVRIDTDSGISGWGEHASAPEYMVSLHAGAIGAIELMAPHLVGLDPRQSAIIRNAMDRAVRGHDYAKNTIDIACWDIAGKAANVPLATLLGGIYQTEFPLMKVVRYGDVSYMREQVARIHELGYRNIQVKVGGNWRDDIEKVMAVCQSAHLFDRIVVDANAHWTQQEALQVLHGLRDVNIIIEQPCMSLQENVLVRGKTDKPFILDESLDGLGSLFRAQELNAFDCAMLKLSRFGGLSGTRLARDNCIAWNKSVTIEDMAGGGIIVAAVAHMIASTPTNRLVTASLVSTYIEETYCEGTWEQGGFGRLPSGPGLGIQVDESAFGEPVLKV